MKEDIIFFIGYINYIGGVETWIYEIAKKYGENRNIVVMYKWIAPKQLLRIEKYIKCIKYTGQQIECNKFIFCYDHSAVKTIKAKEYILTIHADYKVQGLRIIIPKETTSIYCVSKTALDSFIETHKDQLEELKIQPKVLYNPIEVDKPKRVLHLISATRLTKEKGGLRMSEMAKAFQKKGYPISWLVFCANGTIDIDINGFTMMKPIMNITDFIADADYLVQLSDTEGYAYSLVEAMCLGTPVIVTELPILEEMEIKDGENAFVLKFDLSNLNEVVDKAYNNNLKGFSYKKKESNDEYLKILGKETKSKYKCPVSKLVKAKLNYKDIVENKDMAENEEFIATVERAEYLQTIGYVEILN